MIVPLETPPTCTEQLQKIDVSVLTDKEACLQIQKILTEAEKKYPSITTLQLQELKSICEDCQLLAYSFAEEEGKKEDLKKRALRLLSHVEG